MAALKDHLNARGIHEIARAFSRAWPKFPSDQFQRDAGQQLSRLELKGRVKQIAQALRKHLPLPLAKAYPLLLRALESDQNPEGLQGFLAWPIAQYVEEFGLSEPALSLDALKEITSAMSAEFAVRPYLEQHPELALARMLKWTQHESEHVRRLASEGTRPRLPWGQRLVAFQQDPQICLPILLALRQDPSLYVRKSVANHLNDFSKDHPDWLVGELRRWKEECGGDKNVDWILRHASRSLVKEGHPEALSLLGYGKPSFKKACLALAPTKLQFGNPLEIQFSALALKDGPWVVDYAIHHRRANGETTPKVFKWAKVQASKGKTVLLRRRHRIRAISTRRYYAGGHKVEIFVNGHSAAIADFQLRL